MKTNVPRTMATAHTSVSTLHHLSCVLAMRDFLLQVMGKPAMVSSMRNLCIPIALRPLYFLHLDVDECVLGSDNCEQDCMNTFGSFLCSCGTGYRLNEDGHSCDGM